MKLNTTKLLDKIGAVGSFLAAAACPACFPLFAVVATALGLGALQRFEGYMLYVLQGFVAVALVGNVLAWRRHHNRAAFALGVASPLLVFFAIHAMFSPTLIYIGLAGLMLAAIWNMIAQRRCACAMKPRESVELKSTIVCPRCGLRKEEIMATDSCQFFYECEGCKAMLKPKAGDCCVFCSYGTVKCPPKQQHQSC